MKEYTQEQRDVAKMFALGFVGKRDRPLLLYGLGRNTRAILQLCEAIEVAGVMGPDAMGTEWNGKPVLTEQQASEQSADVVIVARDAVLPIIYRRIAPLEKRGVRIFRVDGTQIKSALGFENAALPYWEITAETLKKAIDGARYVSFDIFDTLLARRVLKPENLYEVVEHRLADTFAGFAHERFATERSLGPETSIGEIYQQVGNLLHLTEEKIAEAQNAEWKAERNLCFLRADMAEIFLYAVQKRKRVCLLSDTFYSAKQLKMLLHNCGLEVDVPILTSCDTESSKESGTLYTAYLQQMEADPKDCLHIGDNPYADNERAEHMGLSVFPIMSGYRMLEASSAQSLLDYEKSDAFTLGGIVAQLFSSPFALNSSRGRISIQTPYELGRCFVAPLIDYWLEWLVSSIKKEPIRYMLFPARDGYLIQKLYEQIRQYDTLLPPSVYFKSSRRAMSVAAISTEQDVQQIAARRFRGSTKEFFDSRFGVNVENDVPWDAEKEWAQRLLDENIPAILEHAAKERESYSQYLRTLGLPCGEACGFFDFVAGGTVQHYYEKLTGDKTKGFYFATMNLPNAFFGPDDIAAPFGNITSYGCDSPLAGSYLVLENILTDPDTTLTRIGDDGIPRFENGKNKNWPIMEEVQRGVIDYVRERIEHNEPPATKECALAIWNLLFGGGCTVDPSLCSRFRYEDHYDGADEETCWPN